ncbi:hypothetical protein VTK26DRAFT_2850 [Humicola hyalothermophila]
MPRSLASGRMLRGSSRERFLDVLDLNPPEDWFNPSWGFVILKTFDKFESDVGRKHSGIYITTGNDDNPNLRKTSIVWNKSLAPPLLRVSTSMILVWRSLGRRGERR